MKVVEARGTELVAAPSSEDCFGLLIPESVVVEVEGLPWSVSAELRYSAADARLGVTKLVIDAAPGEWLPARGLRAFQLQGLAEQVIAATVQRVRRLMVIDELGEERADSVIRTVHADDPVPSNAVQDVEVVEPLAEPEVSRSCAEHLARGRSKSSASVKMMRSQAVREYRRINEAGERYPDVYVEIARRLHVGRTTVYRYLKEAGEVGKGKSS